MNVFTELLDWLWFHAPGLLVLFLIVGGCVWFAIKINDFSHRLGVTEKLCNDINTRQLPEIRTELKEINVRLSKIELSLNTIITYLSTKSGKFNIAENKTT